jgi:putative endonuclease
MPYYVYILLCNDGSYYTGIALDVDKRFLAHQNGKGGAYTKTHKPLKILYREAVGDLSSALKRELEIKKFSKVQKTSLIRSFKQSEFN